MAETAVNLLRHSFAMPGALALLLVLPALGIVSFLARRRRRRILARLGRLSALAALTEGGRQWRSVRSLCLSTALTFLITGIAGPRWGQEPQPSTAPGRDLIVVLDLSRSMLADDGPPDRQTRAREALAALARRLEQRGGHRVALVAFASRARVVCPLTHDYAHFREKLAELDAAHPPPELLPPAGVRDFPSGTRIGAGLKEAVARAQDQRFPGQQDILLLSDGDDPADDQEWREGLKAAHAAGIPVHTVGIGDPVKGATVPSKVGQPLVVDGQVVVSRLQPESLAAIAKGTGGDYLGAFADVPRLGDFFRDRIEPRGEREISEDELPRSQLRYEWFFGAALGLLALEVAIGRGLQGDKETRRQEDKETGRQGDRKTRRQEVEARRGNLSPCLFVSLSPCLLVSVLALAGDPDDLVRQGNAAFERGDYSAAVGLYERAEPLITDPGLVAFNQGAALYRLERYREAELHYRSCLSEATGPRRARVRYDLANCLLQQEQGRNARMLTEAIRLYQQCLRLAEGDDALSADARHNLELAKLLRLKAPPPKKDDARDDPKNSDPRTSGSEDRPNPTGADPSPPATQPDKSQPERVAPAKGDQPIPVDQPQPAGRGELPPVPDEDKPVSLPPEDIAIYLQRAAQRILSEHQAHQQSSAAEAGRSVKPW